jgi:hypothetical protein
MSKEAELDLAKAVNELRSEDPSVDAKIAYHNSLTETYMKDFFPSVRAPMELNKEQLNLLTAAVGAGMVAKFGK